jgi:hypothetical protein
MKTYINCDKTTFSPYIIQPEESGIAKVWIGPLLSDNLTNVA